MAPHAVHVWMEAVRIVDGLPFEDEARCHELARAIGIVLNLPVVDGKYGSMEHSWLLVPRRPSWSKIVHDITERSAGCRVADFPSERDMSDMFFVLDVYCAARLPQVQLIARHWGFPSTLYKPGPVRTDINEDKVRAIVALVRKGAAA